MTVRMDEDRLRTPRRLALLDAMQAQPGRTFRGLVRATAIPGGTCAHHVSILERHGLAWTIGHGHRRRHFAGARPDETTATYMARLAGLDDAMTAVLEFVRTNRGCAQKVVLAAFHDRPKSTVQHVLGRLERESFVTRRPSGRVLRHFAEPAPVMHGSPIVDSAPTEVPAC